MIRAPGVFPAPLERGRAEAKHETLRKIVHLVFGLAIALMVQYTSSYLAAIVLAAALIIGLALQDALTRGVYLPGISALVGVLERKDVPAGKGAVLFIASALACTLIFPLHAAVGAVATLAVLDGACTLAGRRFGRHRLSSGKSLEGAFAGFACGTAVLLLFAPPATAIVASALAAVVEAFSPVDDNLTVPFPVGVVLTLSGVG
jgi:dolichol kinase